MTSAQTTAVAYYKALGEKDIETVKKYLHPDIQFTDPQETVRGEKAFLEAVGRFIGIFKTLTIRAQFGSEDQAMIIYDLEIPGFAKKLVAASLLNFQEGRISKIELIYDTRRLTSAP